VRLQYPHLPMSRIDAVTWNAGISGYDRNVLFESLILRLPEEACAPRAQAIRSLETMLIILAGSMVAFVCTIQFRVTVYVNECLWLLLLLYNYPLVNYYIYINIIQLILK